MSFIIPFLQEQVRRFFSHWNTAMCEWVASGWSDEVRRKMPRGYH